MSHSSASPYGGQFEDTKNDAAADPRVRIWRMRVGAGEPEPEGAEGRPDPGGDPEIDEAEVRRALGLLVDPDSAVQIQSLPSGKFLTRPGSDLAGLVEAVRELSGGKGTYATMNPIAGTPAKMAKVSDISRRRWLLVDVDAIKADKDASTTEAEKAASLAVTTEIWRHLRGLGWPDPLFIDSGNCWQLWLRLELPNDEPSRRLVKGVLKALGRTFDTPGAKVDTAVWDARRIVKIPGTMARKGPDTPERPWRMSRVAKEPDALAPVPVEALRALVGDDEPGRPAGAAARAPGPRTMPVGSSPGHAYGRRAREAEVARVAACVEGRNTTLHEAALKLGSLHGAGLLDVGEDEAKRQLEAAGMACRLGTDGDPTEIVRAITNGWSAGVASPRARPAGSGAGGSANGRPADGADGAAAAPAAFSLELVDSATFFAQDETPTWRITGLEVAGQPLVIGGPMKALKTSVLLDRTISLGTGTPFLGHFPVPGPIRVGFISGETGKTIIRLNAREMFLDRGLSYSTNDTIYWGFILPQLNNAGHMRVLRETIRDHALESIGLDPLYLSIVAGDSGVDTRNMFEMGPLLADVANLCLGEGCDPCLCHHFTKHREVPFGPPDLHELAYGGISNFMRQWMLLARRRRFDAEGGMHYLHFSFGGSAGHCGEYALDIETGKLDADFKGRKWKVAVLTPGEERTVRSGNEQAAKVERAVASAEVGHAAATAKQEAKDRLDYEKAIGFFRRADGFRHTKRSFRDASGWRDDRVGRMLYLLLSDGYIRECRWEKTTGKGATTPVEGYELKDELRAP